ncbi:hypothetical protein CN070_28325 [Sinorhizobium meliloti]|nr:hypothetical protein CN070_28325 [Sinorhizobium meliloti]
METAVETVQNFGLLFGLDTFGRGAEALGLRDTDYRRTIAKPPPGWSKAATKDPFQSPTVVPVYASAQYLYSR